MTDTPGPVTQLLSRVSAGDNEAIDRLFPLVYQQLRNAAEAVLRSEFRRLDPMLLLLPSALRAYGRSFADLIHQ